MTGLESIGINIHNIDVVFPVVCFCLVVILFGLGTFYYEVVGEFLVVRRRIFHYIPCGRLSIRLSQIKEIRRYGAPGDWWRGAEIYGNLFWCPGVLVIPRKGPAFRIYITPADPDEFVKSLGEYLSEPGIKNAQLKWSNWGKRCH
jgi:hypothetical protein